MVIHRGTDDGEIRYELMQRCTKRFQRWLFHEVLPSIRKTGSYSLPQAEAELKQLELQLIQAKQHYQDTGHAIALSTSPAMLAWLRGETPPPPQIEYKERFVDPRTLKEVGSASGYSLTQLITDAGLNLKSKHDKDRVNRDLKRWSLTTTVWETGLNPPTCART